MRHVDHDVLAVPVLGSPTKADKLSYCTSPTLKKKLITDLSQQQQNLLLSSPELFFLLPRPSAHVLFFLVVLLSLPLPCLLGSPCLLIVLSPSSPCLLAVGLAANNLTSCCSSRNGMCAMATLVIRTLSVMSWGVASAATFESAHYRYGMGQIPALLPIDESAARSH